MIAYVGEHRVFIDVTAGQFDGDCSSLEDAIFASEEKWQEKFLQLPKNERRAIKYIDCESVHAASKIIGTLQNADLYDTRTRILAERWAEDVLEYPEYSKIALKLRFISDELSLKRGNNRPADRKYIHSLKKELPARKKELARLKKDKQKYEDLKSEIKKGSIVPQPEIATSQEIKDKVKKSRSDSFWPVIWPFRSQKISFEDVMTKLDEYHDAKAQDEFTEVKELDQLFELALMADNYAETHNNSKAKVLENFAEYLRATIIFKKNQLKGIYTTKDLLS